MHEERLPIVNAMSNIDELTLAVDSERLLISAFDGLAASGKSYLANALLRQHSNWQIIHLDELQKPTPSGQWELWSDEECALNFVDTTQLEDILCTLREGRCASYYRFNWATREVEKHPRPLTPAGTVVVEGVYAMRKIISHYYDYTAWVTVPERVRQARISTRPAAEPGWFESWSRGERTYVSTEAPDVRASERVSGVMVL